MKLKIILFAITTILAYSTSIGQTGEYGKLKKNGKYKTYISKEGKTFKVGDTLTIGKPSLGDQFAFITQGNTNTAAFLADNKIIIHKMKSWGTNPLNYHMYFLIKGYGALHVYINYEAAFDAYEIIE